MAGAREVERRVVLLHVNGTSVFEALPAGGAVVTAADPTYAVRGSFVARDASGSLQVNGASATLARDTLVAHGELRVRPTCGRDETPLPESAAPPPASCRYEITGTTTDVYVNGRAFGREAVAARTFLGALLAAAAAALARALPAVRDFLAALYVRVRPEDVLKQPQRRRVYDAICARPGIHFSALMRETGISSGNLGHHLNVLQRVGLIRTRSSVGYRVFWPSHAQCTREDEMRILALAQDNARALAERLLGTPGLSQRELSEAERLPQTTVSYHLLRLAEVGLVEARVHKAGLRPVKRYFPTGRLRDMLLPDGSPPAPVASPPPGRPSDGGASVSRP